MTDHHTSQSDESAAGTGRRKRKRCRRRCGDGVCKRLVDLDAGETGTVERVGRRGRRRLRSMGVRRGKEIKVCSKHPFGGPVVVDVGQSTVSLSRAHARDLEVATEG
ncbi:FeoA family protein [Halorhabdus salina]|uniref:FeoA family protein n=1 Tax=Halorhabdus salina TaxID=2750670 RepID=UPI0015EE538A|nr:FeoA family protein [Halorhabdus salina]